jgi:predicted metal-binding protein
MPERHAIVATPAAWTDILLVCRKCSKKLDGGFGPSGDDTLPQALKHELRSTGRRRALRVVETKCLGLCPKGAVTVIPARSPGTMLAVPKGTDAASLLAMLPPP